MKPENLIEFAAYICCVTLLAFPMGIFIARIAENGLRDGLLSFEKKLLRPFRVSRVPEMSVGTYTTAVLWFSLFSFLSVFFLMIFQDMLPLFPEKQRILAQGNPVSTSLAVNTAASFMTNTNWQAYSGESTLSYLVQAAGLTVQNFASAAAGIAVMLVLIRGFSRSQTNLVGNFWADLLRITFYVLLPASILMTLILVSQGVVQTLSHYVEARTLEGVSQVIPLGPAASQIAIKQLGTNGGGFFGVNSAHPFENPTPAANFVEMIAILWLAAACVFAYGAMTGSMRRAWAVYFTMLILFAVGVAIAGWAESQPAPYGAPLEGKETRIGAGESVLWSVATTAASNGSVNAMHESMMPLSGLVQMFNMHLGEIVFGGVGSGFYGMMFYIIITVFLAGLMVGRTPEMAGKKIEKFEVQMAGLAILGPNILILLFTSIAIVTGKGTAALNNGGPRGFSEMLYAYTSASANNGSAFAGLGVNNDFYNYTLAVCMLIGRFVCLIPALYIGSSLAQKKSIAESAGSFRTDTPVFVVLLLFFVLLIGGLTFLPALTMGPIVEHFLIPTRTLF